MILILLLIATCLQQNVVQKINCHFLYTTIGPNYLVLFEVKKFLLHCTLTSSNNVLFLLSSKHPWHGKARHSPLWAFKSFFQFWSQRAIFHSKRPNLYLTLFSGAPGCPKLICELVTFEKNFFVASKKFRFYTIKGPKYQKILGRKS